MYFHTNNLLGKLRFITYKVVLKFFLKLISMVQTMKIVNQNYIIRICLNKFTLHRSINTNYKEFGVFSKRIATRIMHLIKNFNLDNAYKEIKTRKFRKYNLTVKYENKSFDQCFVDYLGPIFSNFVLNSNHFILTISFLSSIFFKVNRPFN